MVRILSLEYWIHAQTVRCTSRISCPRIPGYDRGRHPGCWPPEIDPLPGGDMLVMNLSPCRDGSLTSAPTSTTQQTGCKRPDDSHPSGGAATVLAAVSAAAGSGGAIAAFSACHALHFASASDPGMGRSPSLFSSPLSSRTTFAGLPSLKKISLVQSLSRSVDPIRTRCPSSKRTSRRSSGGKKSLGSGTWSW